MPAISVWNKCNNKCIMCTNMKEYSEGSSEQYTLKNQIKKMEEYILGNTSIFYKGSENSNYIALTGGEPTLHPDFLKLLNYYRKRCSNVQITLLTNGRTLANEEFAKKYLSAVGSLGRTIIPLHSSEPQEHDYISGVEGSFLQTVKGLENLFRLASPRHEIGLRYIHHGIGKNRLERTLNFILEKFPNTSRYSVSIIHFEIEGQSEINEKEIHLSLKDSAAEVLAAKPIIEKFNNISLFHYPLCVLHPSLRKYALITLPASERVYPEKICGHCCRREDCVGLMVDYNRLFGDKELEAIKE